VGNIADVGDREIFLRRTWHHTGSIGFSCVSPRTRRSDYKIILGFFKLLIGLGVLAWDNVTGRGKKRQTDNKEKADL